jgi:hypothetical protein
MFHQDYYVGGLTAKLKKDRLEIDFQGTKSSYSGSTTEPMVFTIWGTREELERIGKSIFSAEEWKYILLKRK